MRVTPPAWKRAAGRAAAGGTAIKWIIAVVALVAAIRFADGTLQAVAFLLVCLASLVPLHLWQSRGMPGIPVWPVVALIHIQYYGVPILRENFSEFEYGPLDLLRAGLSVTLYLAVATACWWAIVARTRARRPREEGSQPRLRQELIRLSIAGLVMGTLFHLGIALQAVDWIGSSLGVVRAIIYTTSTLSCFFVGLSWGNGMLVRRQRQLCAILLAMLILLSWTSLYLVIGIVWIASVVFGYFLGAHRIPVAFVMVSFAMAYVLHAGKADMREIYWQEKAQTVSVAEMPGFYVDWVRSGITTVVEGRQHQTLVDRASLLEMVLLAQANTPQPLEHLEGATYSILLQLLVPRALSPDKPSSQSAMNMLNVRYGLVGSEWAADDQSVAIGWGLVAEAYVNFGMAGIAFIGMVVGLMSGFFSRWSIGKDVVSLPTILAVVTMMTLANLEADFTLLGTILFQSFIAVLISLAAFRLLVRRSPTRTAAVAVARPVGRRFR